MSCFRRHLVVSGLGGLFACGLLTGVSIWLMVTGILEPPLPHQVVTILTILVFGAFSLAEIPVMVFAMRRLLAERPENEVAVLGLNALYVFFAAVYGVPVLLLTGSIAWGSLLCGLGVVRFLTSLVYVQRPSP